MAKGMKTGGRLKGLAISPGLCSGILPRPANAEQWLGNARTVSQLMRDGFTAKAIGSAIGISQSMVCAWGKAGRRWSDAVKGTIMLHPEKFPPNILTRLAQRLWTDVDPRTRAAMQDGRRNGLPTQSLASAVEVIACGEEPRRERRSIAEKAARLEKLAQSERARSFSLREELKRVESEKRELERQASLDSIADAQRTIASLRHQLALARAGKPSAKAKPQSPDELYLEDRIRSKLRCAVYLAEGALVIRYGSNKDILDGILEELKL